MLEIISISFLHEFHLHFSLLRATKEKKFLPLRINNKKIKIKIKKKKDNPLRFHNQSCVGLWGGTLGCDNYGSTEPVYQNHPVRDDHITSSGNLFSSVIETCGRGTKMREVTTGRKNIRHPKK